MPSRPVMSGRLLDDAVDDEHRRLIDMLRDLPYVAVTADGCKSVSHQKEINFVLVAPNMKPKLWKTEATEANSQTGEYIADLIVEVADEVDAAVGKGRFIADVVTENAKAMIAAWEILEKDRGLICGGCGAHTVNLLLQDIGKLTPVSDVVAKATRVSTFFMQRGLLLARFEQERKLIAQRRTGTSFNRTLSIPVTTRWYSTYNCLVSVIKNKHAIAGVFRDGDFMAQYKSKPRRNSNRTSRRRTQGAQSNKKTEFEAVEGVVQDDEFWALGKQVMKLLAPVIETIGLLETDGCWLGMVYSSFVSLLKKPVYCEPQFLEDTAAGILECILDRWKFLHSDAMSIAFLLDPTKDPTDFVDEDCSKALEQVRTLAARLNYTQEKQDAAFREAGIFLNCKWDWTREQRLQQGQTAPLEWWGNNRLKYPALFELARMIFTMPTSSAAAERSWSIHKYIHSKLRNRLLSETVLKLVFMYSNRMEGDRIPAVLNDHGENRDEDEMLRGCDDESSSDENSSDHEVSGATHARLVDNSFDYDGSQSA